MSRTIVLRPRVEKAIDRAAGWYENRNPRASRAFLDAVDAALEQVSINPHQFPLITRKLHRAIVSGFPYSLLFRLTETEVVVTTRALPPSSTALAGRLIRIGRKANGGSHQRTDGSPRCCTRP